MKVTEDIIGQKFGKLTVVKLYRVGTGYRGRNPPMQAHCSCECGGTIEANPWDMLRGKRRSCGCSKQSKVVVKEPKLRKHTGPTEPVTVNGIPLATFLEERRAKLAAMQEIDTRRMFCHQVGCPSTTPRRR